jgi:hypothetical protein
LGLTAGIDYSPFDQWKGLILTRIFRRSEKFMGHVILAVRTYPLNLPLSSSPADSGEGGEVSMKVSTSDATVPVVGLAKGV